MPILKYFLEKEEACATVRSSVREGPLENPQPVPPVCESDLSPLLYKCNRSHIRDSMWNDLWSWARLKSVKLSSLFLASKLYSILERIPICDARRRVFTAVIFTFMPLFHNAVYAMESSDGDAPPSATGNIVPRESILNAAHSSLVTATSSSFISRSKSNIRNASFLKGGSTSKINSPEIEISSALSNLENIINRLRASDRINQSKNNSPQKIFARKSLRDGLRFFHKGEYLSAIRELENYRDLSQVAIKEQYLAAVHKIGRSHEALGHPKRAIKSYLNYLSSFLTYAKQDFDQMIDVVQRLLELATKFSSDSNTRINRLLSSIVSLKMPLSVRPELVYLTARSAINSGELDLAARWLKQASGSSNSARLRSKSLYFKALIEVAGKNWDKASDVLIQAVSIAMTRLQDKKSPKGLSREHRQVLQHTVDQSRLALARIAVHKSKPQTALKIYNSISEESGSYKDALFESVYLLLDVEDESSARSKAQLFLSRFSEGTEAFQLKSLMAYLSLRSGDISSAHEEVKSVNKNLSELSIWIRRNLRGKKSLNVRQLNDLLSSSENSVKPSAIVKLGQKNFTALASISRRLSEARGEIRDLLYTAGRTTALNFRPSWVNRSEQLIRLTEAALEVGHRLIASERFLYRSLLKQSTIQSLQASENRRISLVSERAAMKREKRRWIGLGNLLGLSQDLSDQTLKIQRATASLATSRYLNSIQLAGDSGLMISDVIEKAKADRGMEISRKQKKLDRMRENIAQAMEAVRIQRVQEILSQSPHRSASKFLSQYSMAIDAEAGKLDWVRDSRREPINRFLAQDASNAWKRWRFAMREIYRQFAVLEKDIKLGLKGLLESVDLAQDHHDKLRSEVQKLRGLLEHNLGESIPLILGHYETSISSRLAKQNKWSADLDWLRYQKTREKSQEIQEKYALEKQILDDNLQSLNQGALWKWPE